MHAAELLESLDALSCEAAERWVAATLAEEAALRTHDDRLYPSADDPSGFRVAHRLHAAWRQWAEDADRLLDRLRPLRAAGHHIAAADELAHAVGRTMAMLQLTPEIILARREQVRRGEVLTVEEVRRELRLKPRG